MALVTRLVRALLLLAPLLAVPLSPGEAKALCPRPCHCPGRGQLDCRHTELTTVPPASRRWALTVLDFTDNFIATVGEQAWKDYPWAENLVLRDNELQAVKSHSLEGLFLLKHLDLSGNKILSIEERAFEPLPLLKFLDLSRNALVQIRSGAFQAWHGMRFLQELILSHNPLAVIADAAFFKLPSVSSLDLSATRVTPQTVLLFLQNTERLETLQVPKAVACCLCQERPWPESPCRTIQFFCKKLCSSSAPQCAHTALLAQTRRETRDTEKPRKLNNRPVLSLKSKESSLEHDGSVTPQAALTPSTEGDVSSLDNSRTNSYPTQHLSGDKGKASVDNLRAKIKKKLHKAKRFKRVKSLVPHRSQPAMLKDVVEKTPSSWDQKKMESGLNWQALNPWDGAGGLIFIHDNTVDSLHKDEEEDPAPRQNSIRTHKWHKNKDSQYLAGHNPFFYQALGPVKAETEPKAPESLNRNLDFLSDPLVQSRPAVSSRGEAMPAEEHSSLGGHLPVIPHTTDTHWKQQEEGSRFLNKPWIPQYPDPVPIPGPLLDTTVDHPLPLLVPDKSLQTFMAHKERGLRTDCSLPQLQLVCARMVSKTGLLLKVCNKRQETQGASDCMGRCPLQENMSRRTALGEDQEPTQELQPETLDDTITFVVLLSVIAVVLLILKAVFHVCSQCAAGICRQLLTRKSCLRRLSVKLQQRWRKNKYREAENVEQDLPELSEAELLLVQYIMDALDKEEEELQKKMQKENIDVSQEETQCCGS